MSTRPNADMIVPSGVAFKFVVRPSLEEDHKKGLRYFITTKSGLSQYFKNIDVECFDGTVVDKEGRSVSEDGQKGKQMLVKVFCPESIVVIEKGKEEDFYKQIKEKFSNWIIGLVESNEQKKYSAELADFMYTQPMKVDAGMRHPYIKGLKYGAVTDKDGKQLLQVSYVDGKGVRVEILVKPNPTGASELLGVIWGGKAVDPLPNDNIAVLDAEAQLRVWEKNVAELEGMKFCSLWTIESRLGQPLLEDNKGEKESVRTQNMANTKYLFGRLWLSDDLFETVIYWTKHIGKDKDKPIAWLAVKSGTYTKVSAYHQSVVERLFQLIIEHDKSQITEK
jgi:hypothetical protein